MLDIWYNFQKYIDYVNFLNKNILHIVLTESKLISYSTVCSDFVIYILLL